MRSKRRVPLITGVVMLACAGGLAILAIWLGRWNFWGILLAALLVIWGVGWLKIGLFASDKELQELFDPNLANRLVKEALQKYGVDPDRLGDACLSEIAHAAGGRRMVFVWSATRPVRAVQQYTEAAAILVTRYLNGETPSTDTELVYSVLKRHGII